MKYKIGTKEKPLKLKTPPLSSDYTMHVDEKDGKKIWYVQWVKPYCYAMQGVWMIYMLCFSNTATGWN